MTMVVVVAAVMALVAVMVMVPFVCYMKEGFA